MADPTPKVLLDRDFVVRAVNRAYCHVTGRDREELISVFLFDAFPGNPHDPEADGVENVMASFDRVLRTGLPDNLLIQRHDIPDPRTPGAFMRRVWMPVHAPLRAGEDVVGILAQVSDVTLLREDVRTAMLHFRAVLASNEDSSPDTALHQRMVAAFTEGIRHLNALADEVVQLREALTTRAIEQAREMLMVSEACGPEEAFDILRRTSRDSNVPLVEAADVVIDQLRKARQAAPIRHRLQRDPGSDAPTEAILTPREKEVVKLIAEGSSSREIAETLTISVKTVDRHRANILAKLGLRDQIALVRYAIRTGLVAP